MVRRAVAVAALLVLAGCVGALPGPPSPTPDEPEPRILGTLSTGGQCVDRVTVGLAVTSERADGRLTVTVAGNVTVPGAHYAVDAVTLTEVDERTARLAVDTTADTGKPVRTCEGVGVVRYEATVALPDDGYRLQVYHDGTRQAEVGGPAES